jgi:hypothetical protein
VLCVCSVVTKAFHPRHLPEQLRGYGSPGVRVPTLDNLRSRSPRSNDDDIQECSAPGASFLEQTLVGGGSMVERRVSSHVDNGGPWRCGVMKSQSQRRTCAAVRAQGGGTV